MTTKNPNPQVFIGGDGAAAKVISPDKLKQRSRFSLNSIIDRLPKLCKDEVCYEEMDDTFSMSSLDASTENGLNSLADPVAPPAPAEEENVLVDKDAVKPAKEQIEKKKEKVPSPTGIMQSRTTKRRSVSRSPRVKDQKKLSR